MDSIYYWIGLIFFWISVSIGMFVMFQFIIMQLFGMLGKKFNSLWIIVEYGYYKSKFKEWVKDQKRHPRCEKYNDSK